jgi:phosphatidylinositol alpha 1,6-mannosyltransferase
MSLRVLYVAHWAPVGGIEQFLSQLIEGLDERVAATVFYAPVGGGKPSVGWSSVRATASAWVWLWKQLRAGAFDVVHLNTAAPLGLVVGVLAALAKVPVVLTHHQLPLYESTWTQRTIITPLVWRYFRHMSRVAWQVATPSQITAATLKQFTGLSAVVRSCGVDTQHFHPGSAAAARSLLRLQDLPTVLFVGRFDTTKRVTVLLEAVARLHIELPLQLLLVGAKAPIVWGIDIEPEVARLGLEKTAHRLGQLRHDDPRLLAAYQACDCFAICSTYETQSIVTLEALACGKPVIATNTGALPELVEPGITGALVPVDDVQAVTDALRTLLTHPAEAKRMGAAGRMQVLQQHSLGAVADQHLQWYQDAVAAAGAVT